MAGLVLAAMASLPTTARVGLAVAAGCLMPPLSPGMRSLWSALVPAGLAQTAFALDAAVFDLATSRAHPQRAPTLSRPLRQRPALGGQPLAQT